MVKEMAPVAPMCQPTLDILGVPFPVYCQESVSRRFCKYLFYKQRTRRNKIIVNLCCPQSFFHLPLSLLKSVHFFLSSYYGGNFCRRIKYGAIIFELIYQLYIERSLLCIGVIHLRHSLLSFQIMCSFVWFFNYILIASDRQFSNRVFCTYLFFLIHM